VTSVGKGHKLPGQVKYEGRVEMKQVCARGEKPFSIPRPAKSGKVCNCGQEVSEPTRNLCPWSSPRAKRQAQGQPRGKKSADAIPQNWRGGPRNYFFAQEKRHAIHKKVQKFGTFSMKPGKKVKKKKKIGGTIGSGA